MHDPRTFYSSAVLKDGRVFVAGGEYGSGGAKAEVYDPVANHWTLAPPTGQGFGDSPSAILPNGHVLVAPVGYLTVGDTLIYDPASNTWSEGGTSAQYQDEASWVKLPDDSILTIDPYNDSNGLNSERYIPSLNLWINDAHVPVALYNSSNTEIGPGLLLPNGRAFFLGGTGHTAIYTPSGDTNKGAWVQGPNIPFGRVAQDVPGAMMVNGKILCEVTSPTNHNPVYFDEYDPAANAFVRTGSPMNPTAGSSHNAKSDDTYMLDLPDGTVLYSDTGNQLYVYQPDTPPLPAGKPTIDSISWNSDGSLHLTGKLFNGISEGASYGDDAQMDSNYPLVRLTDGIGNVYYARTYNWSSTSVRTGSKIATTEATLPANVYDFPGTFSLQVVANGIASDPITFYGPVWVDFNYTGPIQFGDYDFPYSTLAQGVSAVASAGTVAFNASVQPSVSHETMTISKPMTLISVGGPATIGE